MSKSDSGGLKTVLKMKGVEDVNYEQLIQLIEHPVRHDYSRQEIANVYQLPLPSLLFVAGGIHQRFHPGHKVQLSHLLSIKTGGCKENCSYCPQSAHHETKVSSTGLLDLETIRAQATKAKEMGASRFCMGAAWTSPPKQGPAYERLLQAARDVKALGLEVCMTLGMLDQKQADDLRAAGVDYYNHNLDSSPEYYEKIITTRTYQDRLDTLYRVRRSGMSVCCGGIIGMGEELTDRFGLLEQLNGLQPHPESVPINILVKVEGTPLADTQDIDSIELVRMIATARIVLPTSRIRLSAGRLQLTDEAQALCFAAGASSLFIGDKLLTTGNPSGDADFALLAKLGLTAEQGGEADITLPECVSESAEVHSASTALHSSAPA
jgi:biotin synthase